MTERLQIEIRDSLAEVSPAEWNALGIDGNPFLRHEFLHGLEATGCLGQRTGWHPRHVLLRRVSGEASELAAAEPGAGELVGAVPAYLKTNSYGEFVFDWAWADAYQRHGLDYYPKLVAAVPFTPATGRRLLVRPDQPWADTARLLAAALLRFAEAESLSSAHLLFLTEAESALICADAAEDEEGVGDDALLGRLDCQYHWHNDRYGSFEDFLATCTAKRRKTIRRERRYVSDAGLVLERRSGDTLDASEWREVHRLYRATYDRKWGSPSLTEAFLRRMGETFGRRTLVVLAHDPNDASPERPVACAILFVGDDTLYGRYWGCRREYNSLHFEACYYQGIEHCIENGIARFEPGAQGEHKITRGFEPTLTRSAHWIAHPGFRDAIANYLAEERPHVEARCAGLAELLPFRADLSPSP